jgi:photosystem II stability/assembly factor-like uncharacterized protein
MKYGVIVLFFLCTFAHDSLGQGNWIKINSPADSLLDIDFLTGDSGYVLGAQSLYFTSDGGDTWSVRAVEGASDWFLGIHFFSVKEGLLISNSGKKIFRTSDGGYTWEEKIVPGLVQEDYFADFSFTQSHREFGFIACHHQTGEGIALPYSSDMGVTWNAYRIEPTHVRDAISLVFRTPAIGFAVFNFTEASPLFLYRTVDSGKHWIRSDSATSGITKPPGMGYSITTACFSNREVISSFYNFTSKTTLFYKSVDDGSSWLQWSAVPSEVYGSVFFENIGYASAGSEILETTDFGETWAIANNPNIGFISDFSIPSSNIAYAISYTDILKTTVENSVYLSDNNSQLLIFPNPTQDYLLIDYRGTYSGILEVFDAIGRRMAKLAIAPQATSLRLDIRGYPLGVYYARLGSKTVRFIKQ